jgi:N-methylhydantoinase A
VRVDAPVYRFDDLAPAQPIDGPAIVEYSGSTLFLPSGWSARIDERRNAHLTRAGSTRLSAEQSSSKEMA